MFLQTDPIPGGSANAYDYCSQDPINCYDLNGQWGWHNVKKWWKKHGKTTLAITGLVLGVAAAATGVGALVEGSVALGYASAALGVAGGLTDLPDCVHGSKLACVGVGAGVVSGFMGGAGSFGLQAVRTGVFAENGFGDLLTGLSGALGFGAGAGASFYDAGRGMKDWFE